MNLSSAYMLLCVPGTFLPLTQLVPRMLENGINIPLFILELFSTRIGGFFGMDVIVAAVVLLVFIVFKGKRLMLGYIWLSVVATLCIGDSLGLPLFLYIRQIQLDQK